MKIIKTASGKKRIKISKKEWKAIGKKAGWMKTAINGDDDYYNQMINSRPATIGHLIAQGDEKAKKALLETLAKDFSYIKYLQDGMPNHELTILKQMPEFKQFFEELNKR